MAASRTARNADPRPVVAVACSGGRDSMALLHATLQAARGEGVGVLALHVHHGLHPQADRWRAFVRGQCRRWAAAGAALRFASKRLTGRPGDGQSVEAWAREGRYAALASMATRHGARLVLLAHHRRDQAETFVLQALRGAGPAGWSAMPACAERHGVAWARPWLQSPREAIEAYVAQHAIAFVDDLSNADPRFDRNRLRAQVWPALLQAFPQAEAALAGSAGWAQQAAAVLDEIAAVDLAAVADADGLDVASLARLSPGRQAGVLRHWLRAKSEADVVPPASLVQRLLAELRPGATQRWRHAGWMLAHRRGRLAALAQAAPRDRATAREAHLAIRRAGRYRLPGWGGTLVAARVREGGVPLAWLAHLELRERRGGERFQAGYGRPPRSLKKQFQAVDVPAWQRDGPLVFSGGQLVFVPGLGIDARVTALPGQPQLGLQWQADPLPAD